MYQVKQGRNSTYVFDSYTQKTVRLFYIFFIKTPLWRNQRVFCSPWTESLFQTGSVSDTYIVQTVSPACDWALCTQTCGISNPSVLHAEIPPLLWKQWGWNALSETVNIGAAFKLAYVVYVSSSLVYLLSSAGCISWNVQRCSCCSAGGCWL